MVALVRLMGAIMIVMGIIILLNPNKLKELITFWKQGNRLFIAAVLRFFIGILFVTTASECKLPIIISILGILILIKSFLTLMLGLGKFKAILDWWDKASLATMRSVSILAIAIGILILYSA